MGRYLYLLVAHFDRVVETTKVGDDRDAEYAYAAVVGHDDLRDGGHADGITANEAEHAIFGRRLEGGALYADIDTVDDADVFLLSYLVGKGYQLVAVCLVHVGEPRSCGEVLTAQRMLGEEIDMVGDDHQVANPEVRVHATGSIRHKERLDAQLVHHADGEGHLLHVVALIVVEASLHGNDVLASQLTEDQFADMSFNGRYREVGYVAVWYFVWFSDFRS